MVGSLVGVTNSVAFKYGGMIDSFLTKRSVDYDSDTVKRALTGGKALAQEIEENGAVLLKNDNKCLPLSTRKVNIFGWGGSDNGFLYQGGGSSAGGYSADKISFYQAFRDGGIQINESLASAYNNLSFRREGAADANKHSVYYRNYEPGEDFYSAERMNEAKAFSDTAIVVLSRRASEGDDLPKINYDENGNGDTSRRYLSLSAKETLMISKVTANFSKVIVMINSSSPMETGFLEYSGISAAMFIGYPGYYGTASVVRILKGEANPSGHLTDTCAYDIRTAPSYWNVGPDATHNYTGRYAQGRYTDYKEDIYVGYKWYETADAEGYFNNTYIKLYGHEKSGYDAVVQYPFGYGLSYTDFSWEIESVTDQNGNVVNDGARLAKDTILTYKVWVENIGDVGGKDVVELYYGLPYTKGGIEKSSVNLGAFAKTELLKPGKGQEVELTLRLADMASYDTYDKNNNGFMGYELEKGNYEISFRTDSHHVKEGKYASHKGELKTNFQLAETYQYDKDPDTGSKVENLFTNFTNKVSGATSKAKEPEATYAISIDGHDDDKDFDQGLTYLSRADFTSTYPTPSDGRPMSSRMLHESYLVHAPTIHENDVMPKTSSTDTHWTMQDVKGLPYDDPKWQQLIEQLSVEEMANLCGHGGFGTNAIESIGKPKCTDSDGGTGFTSGIVSGDAGHAIKYPAANVLASTWDWKEAYQWGHAIGDEGKALGIQGWYAPGCNVHRSPLGGRNFEYFAEDGKMCGIFVAYTVKGCTENGVYAYMKHFAGNDSDEGRNGQYKWMTEQSLREIYAKPGEIATKVGGANATMVSVDRVGSVRATGSWALLTGMLRNEWGFRGSAITDYYQGGNVNDLDEGIRAGNDLALHPNGGTSFFDDLSSATTVIALQNASHNILYTYIDTVNRTEKFTGVDWSSQTGSKVEEIDGSWWRGVLIGADCGIGLGLVAWASLVVIFTWFKKKQ